MSTTLNHTDGKVTKFEGGVAHVTDQPTSSPKPEAPVQQVLDPDPFSDAAHVIENLSGEEAALSMMDDLMLDQSMNWFQMACSRRTVAIVPTISILAIQPPLEVVATRKRALSVARLHIRSTASSATAMASISSSASGE